LLEKKNQAKGFIKKWIKTFIKTLHENAEKFFKETFLHK
jgi:hypothetical protein